eukprot:TRINITY_DN74201_c0_g1_i1.p1 TRINITY_DN74201_c0_g1~~TRINITY_DN74201_c0_g1_i1.p1  ORF type:complete len:1048 (-),score=179.84 TRINITY_DN74201_c0_g1_i1:31-3174(-)
MEEIVESLTELTDYNREGYYYDAKVKQERDYMEQKLRVKQFLLYREDIIDLMNLTTSKMDAFLIISVIEIGACITMFVEGVLEHLPRWLLWLYTVNLASALLYLTIGAWFAIHASVAAHSFGVRLLTQYVRLPLPNRDQMDAARMHATDLERSWAAVRIPLVSQQIERMHDKSGPKDEPSAGSASVSSSMAKAARPKAGGYALPVMPKGRAQAYPFPARTSVDAAASSSGAGAQSNAQSSSGPAASASGPSGEGSSSQRETPEAGNQAPAGEDDAAVAIRTAHLKHIQMFRQLQPNWQAHDAYARACLALGTYTLIQAMAYFLLGHFVTDLGSIWASAATTLILLATAFLIIRLDVFFRRRAYVTGSIILVMGPTLSFICICAANSDFKHDSMRHTIENMLVPVIFITHALLILVVGYVAGAKTVGDSVALPTRFRAVLYLDVFGWVEQEPAPEPPRRSRKSKSNKLVELAQPIREQLEITTREVGMHTEVELEAWAAMTQAAGLGDMTHISATVLGLQARMEAIDWRNAVGEESHPQFQIRANLDEETFQSELGRSTLTPTARNESSTASVEMLFWCRLVWEGAPAGRRTSLGRDRPIGPQEYFVNSRTHEMTRRPPVDGVISDIAVLGERIKTLQRHTELLKRSVVAKPKLTRSLSRRMSRNKKDAGDLPASLMMPPTESKTRGGVKVGQWSDDEGDNVGTQETRFGGAEASVRRFEHNAHSQVAAQSFFPRINAGPASRRLPGQVPWRVFFITNIVMTGIWIAGFFSEVLLPIDPGSPAEPEEHVDLATGVRLELLNAVEDRNDISGGSGDDIEHMRGRPWHPVALACRQPAVEQASVEDGLSNEEIGRNASKEGSSGDAVADDGGSLFLVERYGVYEVDLRNQEEQRDGRYRPVRQKEVDACLARSPRFHAEGLDGLRVECQQSASRSKRCHAVLVGTQAGATRSARRGGRGSRHLRCGLDRYRGDGTRVASLGPRDGPTLPHEGDWVSSCAIGNHIYALGSLGAEAAEVWRFDVPKFDDDEDEDTSDGFLSGPSAAMRSAVA